MARSPKKTKRRSGIPGKNLLGKKKVQADWKANPVHVNKKNSHPEILVI